MELSKLNAAWKPSGEDIDLEIMTDEERECFRKMGLKMRSCLVLGKAISVFTSLVLIGYYMFVCVTFFIFLVLSIIKCFVS